MQIPWHPAAAGYYAIWHPPEKFFARLASLREN